MSENNGNIKVSVDSEGCISCGACVAISPNVFEFDDNGKSYAKQQPQTKEEGSDVQEAAEACPVEVIHTEKEEE